MAAPPTTGDRFFVITDDDQRGAIWVVSIICCIYILMILVLRWSSTKGAFGVDDWLAAASTLAGLVQYIMIFVATARGLRDKKLTRFLGVVGREHLRLDYLVPWKVNSHLSLSSGVRLKHEAPNTHVRWDGWNMRLVGLGFSLDYFHQLLTSGAAWIQYIILHEHGKGIIVLMNF
jgi:hypothetical protein